MQTIKTTTNKIHPLMAGAAASVMLVSLVGVAAIAGLLPNSRGEAAQLAAAAPAKPAVEHVVASGQEEAKPAPKAVQKRVVHQPAPVRPVYVQQASAPHQVESGSYSQPQPVYQQPAAYQQPQAQPAARVSPIGIAAGAVVGGVLGNQVGGGNGKTLATVAGAIGGGYLGNEVGKRYGY
jgi:uncharacterized protein YcfJ